MAVYDDFPAYVPAAERRRRAAKRLRELERRGLVPEPVVVEGRELATTFWGKAWCQALEAHADLATRLPRGRAYARNGSVLHLAIAPGEVTALVSGTDLYEVRAGIRRLAPARWKAARRACAGNIGTVVELLAGRLSTAVMQVLCDPERGLFPATAELDLTCSCPDGAWLCKHLAAVLYGVGARLDRRPELLFTLRGVDGAELVAEAGGGGALVQAAPEGGLARDRLEEIFGIELGGEDPPPPAAGARRKRRARPRKRPPRRGR